MRNFHLAGRSTVHALNGMAATSHPLATPAAIDVLRAGGTAADAAITAACLLAVIEPQSTGVGGDGFVLYSTGGSDKIAAYNGSGGAPAAATPEWYLERKMHGIPLTGPHSVSVPGAIDLWDKVLADHGRKGLDVALQPAIKAASDGYVRRAAHRARLGKEFREAAKGREQPALSAARRQAPTAGDVVRQPELAEALRTIAQKGRDGFYSCWVAEDLVATLRGAGGLHTLDDFAAHKTEVVTPVKTAYRGYDAQADSAQWPRRDHAADAQHPGRLRSDQIRAAERRTLPSRR